jgi:hypothetical protein
MPRSLFSVLCAAVLAAGAFVISPRTPALADYGTSYAVSHWAGQYYDVAAVAGRFTTGSWSGYFWSAYYESEGTSYQGIITAQSSGAYYQSDGSNRDIVFWYNVRFLDGWCAYPRAVGLYTGGTYGYDGGSHAC